MVRTAEVNKSGAQLVEEDLQHFADLGKGN